MTDSAAPSCYIICHVCSQPNLIDGPLEKSVACARCGEVERRLMPKSAERTLAYSLTALIFYIPANIFPFMTVELYGNKSSSTIWSGIVSLVDSGSWPIALIIFLASMLIPFTKLIVLLYLVFAARYNQNPTFLSWLYRVVEGLGRWSMLDIFLLAVLVAIMKLGPWTSVKPEIGSLLFTLVVIFTTLASAHFDPSLLWEKINANSNSTKY